MFTDRLARARVPRPRRDGHRPFQVQELDPPSDPSPDISATQALRKGVDDPSGGERLRQIGGSVGELVELLPTRPRRLPRAEMPLPRSGTTEQPGGWCPKYRSDYYRNRIQRSCRESRPGSL